jgi:hypothetical protein
MKEPSLHLLRSSLRRIESTTEGAKQRQPDYEVEPNVATNHDTSSSRDNWSLPISTTKMWTAALMDPLYPY